MPAPQPTPATPQLDLFADSRAVMLRNDAIAAVLRRDADGASAAGQALATEDPASHCLPCIHSLVAVLRAAAPRSLPDTAAVLAARQHLQHGVGVAAHALLGADSVAWMAPFWRRLALQAQALVFDADHPDAHAAALWLRCGDAAAAASAVAGIASWRRMPQPLAWMVQVNHASQGLDSVWPMLVELAWMAPQCFVRCAQTLGDALLSRLLRRFDAEFEPDDADTQPPAAWFPAWLANHQPALLSALRLAQPGQALPAEQCFRLVASLLGLEGQGRHAELMRQRARLRQAQPSLYAAYMRSR